MALNAIEGGARALARLERPPVATPAPPAPKAPEKTPTAAATVPPEAVAPARGVPRRLGVQQPLPPNTRLRVDEESKQIVAQVLDENNEVIRQIPPEALLELSARFNRLEGLLFNRET